jgi:carbamoyl-phosphate synthase small subunit
VTVSHVDLNDDVVEGLAALDLPAFSVQYHPEAAAGPHDAAYLFDRFLDLMRDPSAGAAAAGQATDVTDSPKGA